MNCETRWVIFGGHTNLRNIYNQSISVKSQNLHVILYSKMNKSLFAHALTLSLSLAHRHTHTLTDALKVFIIYKWLPSRSIVENFPT